MFCCETSYSFYEFSFWPCSSIQVADVLGKATECVPKEEVTDSNPHLKNLYEGLTMTESVLKSVSMIQN